MKTIAVANQKGGVGKTTTAVNLSACLAAMGRRILLIDLDPQANATSALGIDGIEGRSVYEPLLGTANVTEKIVPTRFESLSLLPADIDLAGVEIEVARMDDHLTRLFYALQPLKERSDLEFIILDCPPSLGILMTNALAAADEVLVPIQCEYFALEGLSKIDHVIRQIGSLTPERPSGLGGIVMTMYDGRTNLNQQVVAEVRNHFSDQVYQTVIPRTVRLGEAPSFGRTIIEYEPSGIGARAYRALAEEFSTRHSPQQPHFRHQPPPSGERA
jgi:chromosome partitioning protein